MIPLSLTISGFLSYRDPVTVNFSHFDLACISGANGAGKSSLLDAITWALFGEARKRDDSVINTQCQVASVRFEFAYEHNIYRVERSKPRDKTAMLEFQIRHDQDGLDPVWRVLTERSLRETERRIEETLRMNYETFINASFFLQGEADQFTKQASGDRKRVLSKILGLDIWEQYKVSASERRREIENQVSVIDGSLNEINAELAQEGERRQKLEEVEEQLRQQIALREAQEKVLGNAQREASWIDEHQRSLDAHKRSVERLEKQLAELETRLEARRTESAEHTEILGREAAIRLAYHEWLAARTRLGEIDKLAERYRKVERERDALVAQIQAARARLEQEGQTLGAEAEKIAAGRSEAAELTEKVRAEEASVQQIGKQVEERSRIEGDLKAERDRVAALGAEKSQIEAAGKDLKDRLETLGEAEGAECPLCGQPLPPNDRAALVEHLENELAELRRLYNEKQAQSSEHSANVNTLQTELDSLRAVETDLQRRQVQLAGMKARLDALENARRNWEADGEPRLGEVRFALETENYELEIRRKLADLEAELNAIGYDPQAHTAAREAEETGRTAEEELRKLESARSTDENLQREISDLEADQRRVGGELAEERLTCEKAEADLELRRLSAANPDEAERLLFQYRERENILQRDLGSARRQVEVLEVRKLQRRNLEGERGQLGVLISRYKQLERAFGKDGVPALLIEQALPEIETRANDILDRLSDGGMMVRFVTQARYKDKQREDLKETLAIEISDGVGVREYELYSGGEAFRVNFAIRLALSQILAQRAGAQLKTLVIDEGFGSQDLAGRQRLIEAINLVRKDFAKILVITHIDELKDAFPNRVEVEKTERGSSVRVL